MNHEAIRKAYPVVQMIDDSLGAFDKDGNKVTIDDAKVAEEAKKLETEWKAKKYQRDRKYPEIGEQLDLLWHAIDDGKFNVKSKDTDFYKKLKAVKDANPKSS